jgi:shikimate kinase
MAECRILLVGLMGSGKTTVGQALAELTGWPYLDNDELVRAQTGISARQVLAQAGELALRLAEGEALEMAVATAPPCICSIAAGTVLSPANRQALADSGIVVWLTAAPQTLAERLVGAIDRPWLEEDAEAWLREAAAARAPLYREVAQLIVDTEEQTPTEVAATIHAELAERPACAQWLRAAVELGWAGD